MSAASIKKFLIVIVGPTAVGKTTLAIELANHFNVEILSADSRQFYKEMCIGTAKPSKTELAAAIHHFIDCKSIESYYSAGDYERDALETLDIIYKTKDLAILVGGSGMYIDALCNGLDEIPTASESLRNELNFRVENEGLIPLLQQLKQLDPEYYNKVDHNNTHRIIRAVEVCLQTGLPYSAFRKNSKKNRPFNCIKIGLDLDRPQLFDRIDKRMDEMLKNGLINEASELINYKDHNALKTVGYTEVYDFLAGKYNQEEMIRLLKRNSRRYSKRQLTWFKKDQSVVWFHPLDKEGILSYINANLK